MFLIYLCSSVCICGHLFAAPPTLTHLFPAGGQRGKSVEVVAAGSFERWPVRVWVSGSGVSATASPTKGKLAITIAANAAPGTYWLRLADEQGASALRPFIVGTLPEIEEKEPNDEPAKAQPVVPNVVMNGRLAKAGDVDCFAVSLKKSQTLAVAVEAFHILRSPMDAIVQIVSTAGFVLAENNDAVGLDSRLGFTALADGVYVVRLFAFPASPDASIRLFGSDACIYRLTLTTGSFAETPTPKRSDPLSPPLTLDGRIAASGTSESFALKAAKGKPLVIRAEVQALGSALTPVLRVLDGAGKQLVRVESANLNADTELSFTPPQDGAYRIEIADASGSGGPWHTYRLRISLAEPDFDLTLASDQFTVAPGTPLDVPVTITRRHGFTVEIDLSAVGLPAGVAASVQGKSDGKSAMLRISAEKAGVSDSFRIVGKAKGKPEMMRTATAALAGFDTITTDLWLTATANPTPPPMSPKKKK